MVSQKEKTIRFRVVFSFSRREAVLLPLTTYFFFITQWLPPLYEGKR